MGRVAASVTFGTTPEMPIETSVHPLPSPPLLLEVGPLSTARGPGERCKLPNLVWGEAQAHK